MSKVVRSILATLCLALVFCVPAQASTYTDIADQVWGNHPCAGQVEVLYGEMSQDNHLGHSAPGAVYINGKLVRRGCQITVSEVKWPTLSPYEQCFVVVHEVGHLLLMEDAKDRSIMDASWIWESREGGHAYEPCAHLVVPTPVATLTVQAPRESLRQQIEDAILSKTHSQAWVSCKRTDTLYRCFATHESAYFRRVWRFRARTYGSTFVLKQVSFKRKRH